MTDARPRRTRRDPVDLHKLLLASARELFDRNGYQATTTAEIARHAGVSERVLFNQFGSKSSLFDAAVVDEEPEAFPSRQGIAYGHGQFALLADQRELCPKPWLERVDQRSAFLLSDDTPFVGASTADVFLNGI